MDYQDFDAIDFILDDFFQEWVLHPSPTTDRFWQGWIGQHPEKEPTIRKALIAIQSLDFQGIDSEKFDRNKVLQNIRAAIKTDELKDELDIAWESGETQEDDEVGETIMYSLPSRRFQFKTRYFMMAAASVFLLILLGVWQLVMTTSSVEYATEFGETKTIILPDNSTVVLNANSRIQYYDDGKGQGNRELDLSGEAFFSVVHNKTDQKFIVRSNGVAVEVLGTEFNVNNRRGKTQVVLKSGKILLNVPTNPQSSVTEELAMEPGDLVEVSGQDKQITKRTVNPDKYASWTRNVLVFDNVPLQEVFEMIQDTYGYNITILDEEIGDKMFEAEISTSDLDLILKIVSKSFNLNIKKQGSELVVSKK
ncbi:MAG: FecR domain-containing protein [Tunicatimonas sp.]|uniref:FecR family protein n=1 Tax=Tunicatimonas sp. TaxID=1940096 RepID=UPI003C7844F8